jgi:hypothetical protein
MRPVPTKNLKESTMDTLIERIFLTIIAVILVLFFGKTLAAEFSPLQHVAGQVQRMLDGK